MIIEYIVTYAVPKFKKFILLHFTQFFSYKTDKDSAQVHYKSEEQ